MKLSTSLSFVAAFALAGSAIAGTPVISTVGPGGAIPDGDGPDIWDPSWNSVPNWPALITSVNVPHGIDKVTAIVLNNLQHMNRGDLHFYLENPAGQRFNVVVQPGADPTNPFETWGDNGDVLVGNYTFVESTGANFAPGDINVSAGTYNQYLNSGPGMYTNPVFPIANVPLSSISGSAGVWKLHLRDWHGTNIGSVASWRLIGENSGATSFCSGDGAATACPCGNNGEPAHGCANSFYPSGAIVEGFGFPYSSFDTMVLQARDLTGNVAVFFQGNLQESATAIDDGLGCVGGTIIRLGSKSVDSGGAAAYPGPGDEPISVKGMIGLGTSTRFYQVMYRNAANFCTPATTNRTNGAIITWVP
jgi:hypothetical protein